jgi:long-chain acyl-CoA synthetase
VEAQGKENRIEPTLPGPDDIATICYTSGTTNVPKGALLSHYNLVSAAIAFLKGLGLQDGAAISYLPLAHIYERVIELMVLYAGCAIGYSTGDPLRLLEDIQVLKPSALPHRPSCFEPTCAWSASCDGATWSERYSIHPPLFTDGLITTCTF